MIDHIPHRAGELPDSRDGAGGRHSSSRPPAHIIAIAGLWFIVALVVVLGLLVLAMEKS